VEAGREVARRVDIKTPRTKEPVMKKRAYIVILAALVALMAASGASARRTHSHSNVQKAVHALKKADKRTHSKVLRRSGRHF
jgi:hypothetical protein